MVSDEEFERQKLDANEKLLQSNGFILTTVTPEGDLTCIDCNGTLNPAEALGLQEFTIQRAEEFAILAPLGDIDEEDDDAETI